MGDESSLSRYDDICVRNVLHLIQFYFIMAAFCSKIGRLKDLYCLFQCILFVLKEVVYGFGNIFMNNIPWFKSFESANDLKGGSGKENRQNSANTDGAIQYPACQQDDTDQGSLNCSDRGIGESFSESDQ